VDEAAEHIATPDRSRVHPRWLRLPLGNRQGQARCGRCWLSWRTWPHSSRRRWRWPSTSVQSRHSTRTVWTHRSA